MDSCIALSFLYPFSFYSFIYHLPGVVCSVILLEDYLDIESYVT